MIPTTDHNDDLSPDDTLSGVLLNYEWRRIVVPVLYDGLLRYLQDIPLQADKDVFIARVDALIDDIYTIETNMQRVEARRLVNQSIAANTDTAIVFDAGDFDATNPSRLYFPISGMAIISVNFALAYGTASVPTTWLRWDGLSQTDAAKERGDAAPTQNYFNETWTRAVFAGQYVEAFVNTLSQPATIQPSLIVPRLAALVINA